MRCVDKEDEMGLREGYEVEISKMSNARLDWSRVLEALEAASAALEDLGACDDPACRDCNCNHALTKVRDVLSQKDQVEFQEWSSGMNCKLRRLVRPSQDAYWWWLPECYAKDGKGHDPRYWSVVRCDAHTDKVGQFVGPLEAPVWPNDGGEA